MRHWKQKKKLPTVHEEELKALYVFNWKAAVLLAFNWKTISKELYLANQLAPPAGS